MQSLGIELGRHGFRAVRFEKMTLQQKHAAFKRARVLVHADPTTMRTPICKSTRNESPLLCLAGIRVWECTSQLHAHASKACRHRSLHAKPYFITWLLLSGNGAQLITLTHACKHCSIRNSGKCGILSAHHLQMLTAHYTSAPIYTVRIGLPVNATEYATTRALGGKNNVQVQTLA